MASVVKMYTFPTESTTGEVVTLFAGPGGAMVTFATLRVRFLNCANPVMSAVLPSGM